MAMYGLCMYGYDCVWLCMDMTMYGYDCVWICMDMTVYGYVWI